MSAQRWAWAEVDLAAVAHNVGIVRAAVAPASVWVVVKADGYGHGSVAVAKAARAAGADGLCVALVQEARVLRDAGVDAPVLVLSTQPAEQATEAVALGVTSTVVDADGITSLAAAARAAGCVHDVHLKIDTGMHRMGCDATDAAGLAVLAGTTAGLRLAGVFTHLATADEPAHPAVAMQLARFDEALAAIRSAGIDPGVVHVANSAGALALPASRHDLVRVGIAVYGISPGSGVDHLASALRPAMSVHARVSRVHRVPAGEGVSYGLRHRVSCETTIATVPIGYADGVSRRAFTVGAEVLIGGVRRPIVGVVTMDQLMVDVGDAEVSVGDHVVLIGEQGTDRILAAEWADRLDTIGYEIVCAISARVPRRLGPGVVVDSIV
ncbi:MAG: alanine racemase [Ilumatobacteraceae bacterium]